MLKQPAVSSGYTPWSAVDARQRAEQPNPIHTEDTKAKTPIITSTDIQGISGKREPFLSNFSHKFDFYSNAIGFKQNLSFNFQVM